MGAFFLIRKTPTTDCVEHAAEVERLEQSMSRQGFGEPARIDRPDYTLRLYRKINQPADNYVEHSNGDLSFCTGTLVYRGKTGTNALRAFRESRGDATIPWTELGGHYCLGFEANGALNLLIDPLGIYKVFRDSEDRVFSSSFLTVLDSLPQVSLIPQAVYEYVFEGTTYGNKTIVDGVHLMDIYTTVQINGQVSRIRDDKPAWKPVREASIEEHLETHCEALRRTFDEIACCFGDNITMGLSGGRDSRLMLALMHDRGSTPEVYVYGKESHPDVRIAREIARGEGFEIDWIDRASLQRDVSDMPSIVEQNFHSFDAVPFRGVFDNGTDLQTRLKRSQSGQLMLNATAAEIYRLTYEYANVDLTVPQFVQRYFTEFTLDSCTSAFDAEAYLADICGTIREYSPHDGDKLTAIDTEHVYLDLRCRFWGARNTSLNNRFSDALTPFLHLPLVTESVTLPYRYRVYGLFLGRLIREFSPSLAKYTSEYGHDFMVDPTMARRLKDASMYYRKAYLPWLNSFRVKQKLRGRRPRPAWLADDAVKSVLGQDFEYMRHYFNVDRVGDDEQYGRVCTLEYFCQQYSGKLSGAGSVEQLVTV